MHPMRTLSFDREPLTASFFDESMRLLLDHWREIAHYQDIILHPDVAAYLSAEAAGTIRLFTARTDDRQLVGYACFFVRRNLHYMDSVQAVSDVIFLDRTVRGMDGWRFLKYVDAQLCREDIEVVYHHVKLAHNFGPILERMGYEAVETIYSRRVRNGSGSGDARNHGHEDDSGQPVEAESEGRGGEDPAGHPRYAGFRGG